MSKIIAYCNELVHTSRSWCIKVNARHLKFDHNRRRKIRICTETLYVAIGAEDHHRLRLQPKSFSVREIALSKPDDELFVVFPLWPPRESRSREFRYLSTALGCLLKRLKKINTCL
ncbi:hypothetical protein PUN28_006030 [Cardiocondyla obscurior]|uniref:Uncharacterized protein n=1 Tax=Cardiocondyla obscurior TaxID=286306 RepID=A0AAW2G7C4_9HYME